MFKAAREDSNVEKKYDETGLVVSSCKHCIVSYAINMFKGESRLLMPPICIMKQ